MSSHIYIYVLIYYCVLYIHIYVSIYYCVFLFVCFFLGRIATRFMAELSVAIDRLSLLMVAWALHDKYPRRGRHIEHPFRKKSST